MPERLRVMIVDEDDGRGAALAAALTAGGYHVAARVTGGGYLPRDVAACRADVVLVSTASPSRDTLEQLGTLHRELPRPVVMFATDEARGTIREAVAAGVSAYVTTGLTHSRVEPIIDVAIEQFKVHQAVRSELRKTRAHLDERKTLDRAKGILMERREISETEAHRALRSIAMERKQRIGEVAAEIVRAAALLEP